MPSVHRRCLLASVALLLVAACDAAPEGPSSDPAPGAVGKADGAGGPAVALVKAVNAARGDNGPCSGSRFEVRLSEPLGDGDLAVHATSDGDDWADLETTAQLLAELPDGGELWGLQGDCTELQEFAVRYADEDSEVWDNGGGDNYAFAGTETAAAGPDDAEPVLGEGVDVALGSARLLPGTEDDEATLTGQVYVRNLGFEKDVAVQFDVDGSPASAPAVFLHGSLSGNGTEVWSFQTTVGADAELNLSVRYAVGDELFVDDNFGLGHAPR